MIIAIPVIDVAIYRTMNPCLTIFGEEKRMIKGIVKSLDIIKCFLKC